MAELEQKIIPRQFHEATEDTEAFWSWAELRTTGTYFGRFVRLVTPLGDTDPATVEKAKRLVHEYVEREYGG